MTVKELKEPIWEKQEGETPNQHDWFNEFLDYTGYSLKAFHEYLESNRKTLKVTEAADKIPSINLIKKWSSINKWTIRKKAKRDFDKQEEREELKKIKENGLIDNFLQKQKIEKQLLKEISLGLTTGKPLSQINQGIQGYVTFTEDDRKDLGEDDKTLKIDATTEVKSGSTIGINFEKAYDSLIEDTLKNSTHLKRKK